MEQTQLPGMEQAGSTLEGVVESIVFASDDGKFAVLRLRPKGQQGKVNVTVNSVPPLVGRH